MFALVIFWYRRWGGVGLSTEASSFLSSTVAAIMYFVLLSHSMGIGSHTYASEKLILHERLSSFSLYLLLIQSTNLILFLSTNAVCILRARYLVRPTSVWLVGVETPSWAGSPLRHSTWWECQEVWLQWRKGRGFSSIYQLPVSTEDVCTRWPELLQVNNNLILVCRTLGAWHCL